MKGNKNIMTQEEKKVIEYCNNRFREAEKQGKELTKEELMNEIIPKPKVTDPELIKRIDEAKNKCDELLALCEETRIANERIIEKFKNNDTERKI